MLRAISLFRSITIRSLNCSKEEKLEMRRRATTTSSRSTIAAPVSSSNSVFSQSARQASKQASSSKARTFVADWRPEPWVDQWKPSSLFSGGAWLRSHIIDSALEQAILGSHSLTPTKYHHHVIPIRWWWDQSTANEPTHTLYRQEYILYLLPI